MTRRYVLKRTPADEAEQLWRDVSQAQKQAQTPEDWMRITALLGRANVAFQRAVLWRLTCLQTAVEALQEPAPSSTNFTDEDELCRTAEEVLG